MWIPFSTALWTEGLPDCSVICILVSMSSGLLSGLSLLEDVRDLADNVGSEIITCDFVK